MSVRESADWIMWLGLLLFLPVLGLKLSDIPDFKIYQLYNLIGIAWALLGAFYLSFLVNQSQRVKEVTMRISYYIIIWLLFMIPIALILGGVIGSILDMPSWRSVAISGSYLLMPAAISVFLIEDFSEHPKFKFARKGDFRVVFLGGYFVVTGFILQFVAGVFDLISYNG